MACCRPADRSDAGYATPAALVLALALSLVASAMVARSVMLLRAAKADLERAQAEHALDGAHLQAAATVVRAGAGGPYRFALTTDAGWVEALVEPEHDKLSLTAAADLPEQAMRAFGVADPGALKTRLLAAAQQDAANVVGLDPSPLWRACASSLVSSFGGSGAFTPVAPVEPHLDQDLPAWRVGEAWRVRITTAAGWRDDRIVRFTGDARHPAATVVRVLSRGHGGHEQCDEVLAAVGAA